MFEDKIEKIIALSLENLPRMLRSDNIFCYAVACDREFKIIGRSLRYTLICLIGLARAASQNYSLPVKPANLWHALLKEFNSNDLTTGDYGLFLWCNELYNFGKTTMILSELLKRLPNDENQISLLGMEQGWIVVGLSKAAQNGNSIAKKELEKRLTNVLTKTVADSGLFLHNQKNDLRSGFPNFATQIYNIHALAIAGNVIDDTKPIAAAVTAADIICRNQLECGGWPWIFNAKTGNIVEQYEIYSVHQDAMAPMGLFSLFEATNNPKYIVKALRGLEWIFGSNEIEQNMIDPISKFIFRSIRRKRSPKAALYANALSSHFFDKPFSTKGKTVEVNKTCRPYHLGWILEAWCGRNSLLGGEITL